MKMKYNTIFLFLASLQCFTSIQKTNAQQQQDPTTLNGGSILAMAGKNCVAVAVDKRFGSGPQTINISPRTVLIPHSRLMVGFAGLEGDIQSLASELSTLVSEKKGRHLGFGFGNSNGSVTGKDRNNISSRRRSCKEISPQSMSMLLSHVLYGRRRSPYYIEPIVAGLEKKIVKKTMRSTCISIGDQDKGDGNENGKEIEVKDMNNGVQSRIGVEDEEVIYDHEYVPFLCAQDVIGAQSTSSSFVCSGAASKSLYGTAEAMWRPDLNSDELVQVCGRAFLSALERDCLSGYGATIYLLVGGEGIIEIDLACRND